jgi:CheY-like chemotaxis protein
MSRVLLAVSAEWQARVTESVLWRSGVERFTAPDGQSVLDVARPIKARMVVLDAADPGTEAVIRRLREDPQTRSISIAVLARTPSPEQQEALAGAGANAVLTETDGPAYWDDLFEQLLGVPPRQEVRVPVAITIWSRRDPGPGVEVVGVSINVSVTGLLIETRTPLTTGTTLNLSFRLPTSAEELRLMGRVVWTAPGPGAQGWRSGIEFLGFHGRTMEAILAFSATTPEDVNR